MFYKIVLILVLLSLAWLAYRLILHRVEFNRQKSAFNLVFKKFDGSKPKLEIGNSYGYPSFKLIFKTKEDMDKAQMEGLIKQFTVRIQEICQLPSDAGREVWSFDAERAIYATNEDKHSSSNEEPGI